MNGAQALVEMLIGYGTRVVFGLPGDTSIDLCDAFYERSRDLTHLLARDERSAAFMADVYARLSGKPGICEGPSGGGATYLLPGVAEANGSSVALVALTTDNPLDYEAKGALTELDQSRLYSAVTKWGTTVKNAEEIPRFVRRAFRCATGGRPGAVHLALPKNILSQEVPGDIDLHIEEDCKFWPSLRTRPAQEAISRVAWKLLQAERPVIIAGGGAVSSGAHEELLRVAQFLAALVATTINGKGVIAETSPYSIGVIGANGGRPYAHQMIQQADLVMSVGCKMNYVDSDSWRVPPLPKATTIVQIDIDPSEIGNNYPVDEGLCGDARLVLGDLLDALHENHQSPADQRSWLEYAAKLKASWRSQGDDRSSSKLPIRPQRVIAELRKAVPSQAIFICDPGTPTPYMSAFYELDHPGRWIISPRAQGGLGYAIPGLVGARLAKPECPVFGLCGDGSFLMSCGELATIARVGGPIVVILFNNRCYGWIKALQKLYCGGRYFSVDLDEGVNYVKVAEGFGLPGVQVNDPEKIASAIQKAMNYGRPYLIELLIASEHEVVPPVAPWQRLTNE